MLLHPGSSMQFVGRQRELDLLGQRLEEAAAGNGGVVLVGGEPGVGKTRLTQELIGRARAAGRRTLLGRAYEVEVSPPYLPIAEVLSAAFDCLGEDEIRALLGEGAADVAVLAPRVLKLLPGLSPHPAAGPGDERHRLFESVSLFLLEFARSGPRGLLLVADDLHWADPATLQLLVHLARRVADAPLLLVPTYRTVGLSRGSQLSEALADLSREATCERIALGPLSIDQAGALMAQSLGLAAPRSAVEALYRKTEGNPFFVREVLRHLQTEGCDPESLEAALRGLQVPEGARQVVAKRLARLSEGANRLLEASAILGDGAIFDVLASVCGGRASAPLDSLEEVVAAGMLREEGEGYHLAHALIRQTISDQLLAPRRQRLHLRAAEAIERIHSDNLDRFAGALALHYGLCGTPESTQKAVVYARKAAELAVSVFAHEAAIRQLEAAVALVSDRTSEIWLEQRAGLLRELGTLLFASGLGWTRSVACLEEALRLYERLGRAQEAALTHIRLGHARCGQAETMDIPRAREHLRIAETTLGQQAPGLALGDLYHALAVTAYGGLRTQEGLAASFRALEIAEQIPGESLRARASLVNGGHLIGSGQIAAGLRRLERGWEAACRARQVYVVQLYGSIPSDALVAIGAPKEAAAWARRSLAELERSHASPDLLGNVLSALGRALIAAGELADSRRLLERVNLVVQAFQTARFAAHVALADGDWERSENLAGQIRARARRGGHRQGERNVLDLLGRSARAQGWWPRARELYEDALALAVDGARVTSELATRVELAILAAQLGRPDDAAMNLARCREILAGGEDWRGLAGRCCLAEAVTFSAAGSADKAEQRFGQAVETFRRFSLPWDEADALQLWGAALTAAEDRSQSAEMLAQARAVYERIEAGPPWLEAAAALERRLAPAVRAAARYPDHLTAREVDVLLLLASGESNREIAERLVLSPRTAERHVASIYRKIGARRRADAISYALHHGLDGAPAP